jgi:two-component system sensor histidine kinase GlrK
MIIGPVKGIERMINRLGEGRSLGDGVLLTGPRELRSVGQRIIWLSERLSWRVATASVFTPSFS